MSLVAEHGHTANSEAGRYVGDECIFWELLLKGEDMPVLTLLLSCCRNVEMTAEGPAVALDHEVEMKILFNGL